MTLLLRVSESSEVDYLFVFAQKTDYETLAGIVIEGSTLKILLKTIANDKVLILLMISCNLIVLFILSAFILLCFRYGISQMKFLVKFTICYFKLISVFFS